MMLQIMKKVLIPMVACFLTVVTVVAQPTSNPAAPLLNGRETVIAKVEFDDTRLRDVARVLSEHSGLNVVTTPDAAATSISTYLQQVNVKQAVEMIAKSHGLWYREEPKNNAIRIMTVKEYQDDLVVYRDDETKVFDLLSANVQDMAQMVADVYGDRVRLSLGREPGNNFDGIAQGSSTNSDDDDNRSISSNNASSGQRNSDANGISSQINTPILEAIDPTIESQFVRQSVLNDTGAQEAPISVTVNNEHNLLIVRTSDRKALEEITALIDTMNRPVPQVLLEMKILEVQIGDGFRSIFDVQGSFGTSDVTDEDGDFLKSNQIGLGNFLSEGGGFLYRFLDNTLRATLEILLSEDRINVVSTPIILASNHRETELFLGEETILTTGAEGASSENNNTNGDVVSNVVVAETEQREIGNTITLTPRINGNGTVNIELEQDTSTINPDGASIFVSNGAALVEVSIDTVNTSRIEGTFMAKDGKTVVIGGLIRDNKDKSVSKVPILGDIPGISWLFRRETQNDARSELVLLITPHIIYDATKGQDISRQKVLNHSRYAEWSSENTPPSAIKPQQQAPETINELLKFDSQQGMVNAAFATGGQLSDSAVVSDVNQAKLPSYQQEIIALIKHADAITQGQATTLSGVRKLRVNPKRVQLFTNKKLHVIPQKSWQRGGLFVTTVLINNKSKRALSLNPADVKGNWVSASFSAETVLPSSVGSESVVRAYLVSKQPFNQALNNHQQTNAVIDSFLVE